MKKFHLLFLGSLLLSIKSISSQTATSIANGNWTNPFTWNCTCVPTTNYSVTINHAVTLNTSMAFTSGGLTINSSGSLIQDASLNRDLWINGGSFNNLGTADFRNLLVSTGTAANAGALQLVAMSTTTAFNNSGTITLDSVLIAGAFTNTSTGSVTGDRMTNMSALTNNGTINMNLFTNTGNLNNYHLQLGDSLTNAGTYNNYDSLILTGSLWNILDFNNSSTGHIHIVDDFFNVNDSTTAQFMNDGVFISDDSWYNSDTVSGSGYFTVSDTSANSGSMINNFNFCDLTPPVSAPFVDSNSGFISPSITWCSAIGIKEISEENILVYPNPNNGSFKISGLGMEELLVLDVLGKKVNAEMIQNARNIEISGLLPGVYFVHSKTVSVKVVVTE